MHKVAAARSWVALGFSLSLLSLVTIAVACRLSLLSAAGWGGGQYAHAFLAVTIMLLFGGCFMAALGGRTPWRYLGIGTVIGGGIGIAVIVGALVWFWIAWQSYTF